MLRCKDNQFEIIIYMQIITIITTIIEYMLLSETLKWTE